MCAACAHTCGVQIEEAQGGEAGKAKGLCNCNTARGLHVPGVNSSSLLRGVLRGRDVCGTPPVLYRAALQARPPPNAGDGDALARGRACMHAPRGVSLLEMRMLAPTWQQRARLAICGAAANIAITYVPHCYSAARP